MIRGKFKKTIAAILSLTMLCAPFISDAAFEVSAPDVTDGHWETDANGAKRFIYFYDQLTTEAKKFYNAMAEMYESGIFKTGNGEYSLTDNSVVTQEQLDAYAHGDNTLLNTYGAARDAFCADFPDVFYVDFDQLSIVVRKKQDGTYTAALGAGRSASYYRYGFTSKEDVEAAEETLNEAADKMARDAKDAAADENYGNTESENGGGSGTGDKTVYTIDELRSDNSAEESAREKTEAEKIVTAVHDALIRTTVYKLDTTSENEPNRCKEENIGHVRTVYGPLVAHESLCEGYSRALKTVLDRAGVPCVLVQGVYMHTKDTPELHMWNYVRIDENSGNKWYAVDSTFDDPIVRNNGNAESGQENSEYLMVGADEMDRQHVSSGEMSGCGFEFTYPALEMSGTRYDTVYSLNGLEVEYSKNVSTDPNADPMPAYKVSYNGKGYERAAKEDGMYILVKLYGTSTEDGSTAGFKDWVYADTGLFDGQGVEFENDNYTLFPAWHLTYAEFAVTDIPPIGHWYDGQKIPETPQIPDPPSKEAYTGKEFEYQYYKGDPLLLEGQTGLLHNPEGTYMAPPYIKKATPSQTGRLSVGGTYKCEIVYDQPLVAADETSAAGAEMPLRYGEDFTVELVDFARNDALGNVRKDIVVQNAVFDGDRTVRFDFCPEEMWAGDCIIYKITLNSLKGKISQKTPNDIVYHAAHGCAVCAYRSRGYFWNVFAKPQLMENSDLSTSGWTDAQGNTVDGGLTHRMTLVVSETDASQDKTMNDLIEKSPETNVDKVLSSSTYNIALTLCKCQVVETGQSVRISMGFPYPYGPDDEGVTFKAYHFKKDSQGNTIEVEEIPCEITRYGLVILCNSFSPFAVAAVKTDDGEAAEDTKQVLVSSTYGGSVTSDADSEFISLKEGGTVTLTLTPFDGYDVETVMVGSNTVTPTDNKITISYDQIDGKDIVVEARFAETAALKNEEKRAEETGESLVMPQIFDPSDLPREPEGAVTVNADGSVSALVKNNTIHAASTALMTAAYENGALKSLKLCGKNIQPGGGEALLKVDAFTDTEKTSNMRAFLWNLTDGKPIDAKTVN